MKKLNLLLILVIAGLTLTGCSDGDVNPAAALDVASPIIAEREQGSERILWGAWIIDFDQATHEITINPLRNAQAHFNVTNMITPPECYDCLEIHVNSFDPVTRILDVDVTLRNKYNLTGRDVRGILYTNDIGHELRNADDWTGLWDIPGGEDINPFKAFAKDEPDRIFAPTQVHTENYLVYIPSPPQWSSITYAVDASWPGNCKEPYTIEDFTQQPIGEDVGSEGLVQVTVRDWQGDVDSVMISVPEITTQEFVGLSPAGGGVWEVNLINYAGAVAGDYPALVKATSAGSGDLALYDYSNITITELVSHNGWARTWGGPNDDSGNFIAWDGFGNTFTVGHFRSTVDFDPGPGTDEHTSKGSYEIFVSKFDSNGDFQWAHPLGDTGDDRGSSVAADSAGNAYVLGVFKDTVDFDPGPGTAMHTSNGGWDISLIKFDPAGDFQWCVTWGGTLDDRCGAVCVDGSSGVNVAGYFQDTVDFDPQAPSDPHTSSGGIDIFLSKFDTDGNYHWVRTWGGSGQDSACNIINDGDNNIYIAGYFQSTVDFDPGAGSDQHSSHGDDDAYLCKFDTEGLFLWARTWGASDEDIGFHVGWDGLLNLYVSGSFRGSVDFDPGAGTETRTANGYNDAFLSKFDLNGTFQWVRAWGSSYYDVASGVAAADDNIYVTGYFSNTVDFDPGPGVDNHSSVGEYDAFLGKFDSGGDFKWTHTWGAGGWDKGSRVTVDDAGNCYGTGYAGGTIDFDPGPGVDDHTSNGNVDCYVIKILPDGYW